jgi:hypothetical protein
MKTVLEHFETLPEPYRTQAIENCKDQGNEGLKVENLDEAFSDGFVWSRSKQGYDHWDDFYDSLSEYDLLNNSTP